MKLTNCSVEKPGGPPRRSSTLQAALVGFLGVLLAGSIAGWSATPDQAPPVDPGQARVWFLRQLIPGTAMHAPMIYANGAPVAISSQGTVFYRNFAPGTYTFSVDNCMPQRQTSQTLTLAPGNDFALQVQSAGPAAPDCDPPVIFYLSPPAADMLGALFAPLAYLGPR